MQLTVASTCVYFSCFGEVKHEMDMVDRRVNYMLCHDIWLHISSSVWMKLLINHSALELTYNTKTPPPPTKNAEVSQSSCPQMILSLEKIQNKSDEKESVSFNMCMDPNRKLHVICYNVCHSAWQCCVFSLFWLWVALLFLVLMINRQWQRSKSWLYLYIFLTVENILEEKY